MRYERRREPYNNCRTSRPRSSLSGARGQRRGDFSSVKIARSNPSYHSPAFSGAWYLTHRYASSASCKAEGEMSTRYAMLAPQFFQRLPRRTPLAAIEFLYPFANGRQFLSISQPVENLLVTFRIHNDQRRPPVDRQHHRIAGFTQLLQVLRRVALEVR